MIDCVLARKNPVDWMIGLDVSAIRRGQIGGAGYLANSVGVTMLTRTSVVCADRTVAMSSSNGEVKSSSQCASG